MHSAFKRGPRLVRGASGGLRMPRRKHCTSEVERDSEGSAHWQERHRSSPVKQRFNTQGRKGRWECVVELVTENSAGGMDKVGRGQKCISRGDLLSMSTGAIRFVVGSTTDVLLSPVNRRRCEAVLPAYTRKAVEVRKAKEPQQVKSNTFMRKERKQMVEQACVHSVYMGFWQRHMIRGCC